MLEIILRSYNSFDFRVKGNKIILPTNQTYTLENKREGLDKIIVHKKNSLGFRGENPPKDFSDKLTVITIGGSTTEDFYLSEGKTWTDILGMKLKNSFNNIWINNAGLSGQSTFGHIILMDDYITKIKPKIVLFLIGSNDLAAFNSNKYDKNMQRSNESSYSLKSAIKVLAKNSEVLSVALNINRYINARKMGLIHSNKKLNEFETIELSNESKKEIRQSILNRNYKPFEQRLKKLIQLAKTHNIEPIFITQPTLLGDTVDDITNVNLAKIKYGAFNGELAWENFRILYDVIKDVGKKENVFIINLGSKMPKSSLYYYDLLHFNNKGAQKVAEIIYPELCSYLSKRYSNYQINDCNPDS